MVAHEVNACLIIKSYIIAYHGNNFKTGTGTQITQICKAPGTLGGCVRDGYCWSS
jgi:hypothetical protein